MLGEFARRVSQGSGAASPFPGWPTVSLGGSAGFSPSEIAASVSPSQYGCRRSPRTLARGLWGGASPGVDWGMVWPGQGQASISGFLPPDCGFRRNGRALCFLPSGSCWVLIRRYRMGHNGLRRGSDVAIQRGEAGGCYGMLRHRLCDPGWYGNIGLLLLAGKLHAARGLPAECGTPEPHPSPFATIHLASLRPRLSGLALPESMPARFAVGQALRRNALECFLRQGWRLGTEPVLWKFGGAADCRPLFMC